MARNEKEEGWSWRKVGAAIADKEGGKQALGSNKTLDWLKACKATV